MDYCLGLVDLSLAESIWTTVWQKVHMDYCLGLVDPSLAESPYVRVRSTRPWRRVHMDMTAWTELNAEKAAGTLVVTPKPSTRISGNIF